MMTPDSTESRTILQNALEALKRGDRVTAQRLAQQAVSMAPETEAPWLFLAALTGPAESLEYIRKALQINPDSQWARQAWDWALRRLPAQPSEEKIEQPPQPAQPGESEQPPEPIQPPEMEAGQPAEAVQPTEVEQPSEPVPPVTVEQPPEPIQPSEVEAGQPVLQVEAEQKPEPAQPSASPVTMAEASPRPQPVKAPAHTLRWILLVLIVLLLLAAAGLAVYLNLLAR
ncbi:MAG: hypothetical protein ABSE06_14260 [Anaerolineaceae bacterium]|jgi:hypothetical protein